jgi:hypothetical protein
MPALIKGFYSKTRNSFVVGSKLPRIGKHREGWLLSANRNASAKLIEGVI